MLQLFIVCTFYVCTFYSMKIAFILRVRIGQNGPTGMVVQKAAIVVKRSVHVTVKTAKLAT